VWNPQDAGIDPAPQRTSHMDGIPALGADAGLAADFFEAVT
jgi:hypothetical protein